jgi:hypothetical protein
MVLILPMSCGINTILNADAFNVLLVSKALYAALMPFGQIIIVCALALILLITWPTSLPLITRPTK